MTPGELILAERAALERLQRLLRAHGNRGTTIAAVDKAWEDWRWLALQWEAVAKPKDPRGP